jgi:hypothetical protein
VAAISSDTIATNNFFIITVIILMILYCATKLRKIEGRTKKMYFLFMPRWSNLTPQEAQLRKIAASRHADLRRGSRFHRFFRKIAAALSQLFMPDRADGATTGKLLA